MNILENYFLHLENIKVIDQSIDYSQYTPIDLSVSNEDLAKVDQKNATEFESYVQSVLEKNNAKVAYGGYIEKRSLYQQSTIFKNDLSDERNIHIGLDLWIKAGTAVLAALEGKVHGFGFNDGLGNYGPTLILEHKIENSTFYTLYGHLSMDSIENENIEIGSSFKQGQVIGTLGDVAVNGGYAPHLHFQIIKDITHYTSDYPGVCSAKDLEYYLQNCPDPKLLLKIK